MPMRRLVLIPLLLVSLLVVATAGARDPRLEQVRLNAADNALAKRIALTPRDVGVGWRRASLPDSDEQLQCPGFNPNLSRFTITGKATRAYSQPTGASIVSAVEVYKSRADAAGDFRAAATPAVARCLKIALEREFGAGAVPVRVRSAKVVPAPRLGERRIAYRVIAALTVAGNPLNVYFDVLVVQKGRSIVALFFTSPLRPLARQSRLASTVVSRMR
jgi:hypothetical protein